MSTSLASPVKYGIAGEITSEIMSSLDLAKSEGSVRGFGDNILVGNGALHSLKRPTLMGRAPSGISVGST